MMDFNQILLFAGLGLLVLVILFALWGFLGGLKRELKCIAVFIVLLVLFWLVFGDEATLLNAKYGQSIAKAMNINDNSITTVWDAILAYARLNIPNGKVLLVEGKETYTLFYAVVSCLARAIGLIVGTIAVVVICPIIRLITHIIGLIINGSKKRKALSKAAAGSETEAGVEETEEKDSEQVVMTSSEKGVDEAVIVKEANEIPQKPKGKRRWWGAFAATLKGIFLIIVLFTPISGLCNVLNTATPETQAMLDDLASGKDNKKNTANSDSAIDMLFEFSKAYENSGIGKFVEGSSYFFGKSFSESMFNNITRIETKNQILNLGDELSTLVKAANELNGKTDIESLTDEEVARVMDALKNSKLLVEVMPVAIEYAYEIDDIKKLISDANQAAAFLDLRYNNWKSDLSIILDTVKEAYKLDIFPLKDFNYLTMDSDQLRKALNVFSNAEVSGKTLEIASNIATKLDVVKEKVGDITISNLLTIDWAKEINTLVDAYELFQKFGIDTFKDFDFNAFIKEVLNTETEKNTAFELVDKVLDLQILETALVPTAVGYLSKQEKFSEILADANQTNEFAELGKVVSINDIRTLVHSAKLATNAVDFTDYPNINVDYFAIDETVLRDTVNELARIASLNQIAQVGSKIALSIEKVKEYTGNLNETIDLTNVNWATDFNSIVDMYAEFKKLGYKSMDDFKAKEWNKQLETILNDEQKYENVKVVLTKLVGLDLYNAAGGEAIQNVLNKMFSKNAPKFENILELTGLTADQWQEDINRILEIAKAASDINALESFNPFDYKNLDLVSDEAVEKLKLIVDRALALNILGNDEIKNNLLAAAINQYQLLIGITSDKFAGTDWKNESNLILEVIDAYAKLNKVEGFDIYDIQNIKWQELLESDDFIDAVVDALEALVDSNVLIKLMPNLLDEHLMPMLDKIEGMDDSRLFQDIFDKVGSEELVKEVTKLINLVKDINKLNVLNAGKDGVGAIDLTQTEALKNIIAGIFDSKLISGYEGRVIRIILKLTKVLDIPKDSLTYQELISIDYTGEKEKLIDFVDAIAPVLQDETFKLVDEEGKFKLDPKFWAENKNAQTLLEGIKKLFGTYGTEDEGSKLIAALLPDIYDKYIEEPNRIPEDFVEIVDILDVTNASGGVLTHDLRCLIYVLEQLVSVNAQSFLDDGNIEINENLKVVLANVIDALHEIELIHGSESETLTWGVNYVAKLVKVDVTASKYDFEGIDWQAEKANYKDIINDIVDLAIANNIKDYKQLVEVIDGIIKVTDTTYVTDVNANELLNILDKIVDVKVIDAIIPLAVKFGVKTLGEKGYTVDYINSLTNEELVEDFHSIVNIAHIAVDDLEIVKYYNKKFANDLELPNEDAVKSLVKPILELNVINKAEGKLATMLYNKLMEQLTKNSEEGKEFFLTVEDFKFETIDWVNEETTIIAIIDAIYDAARINSLDTLGSISDFIKNQGYKEAKYHNDRTGRVLTTLLRNIKDSQIIANIIEKCYKFGLSLAESSGVVPFSINGMADLSKELLIADIDVLADILDEAIEFGALQYIDDKDIVGIDATIAGKIVKHLYQLNVVKENIELLAYRAMNYYLGLFNDKNGTNITVHYSEIQSVDFANEFEVIGNAVSALDVLLKEKALTSISSIKKLFENKGYNNADFFTVVTGEALSSVLNSLADSQLLELVIVDFANFGIDKLKDKADLTPLKDAFTAEELVADIKAISGAIVPAIQANLVGLAFKAPVEELVINLEAYRQIVNEIQSLNVINKKYDVLASILGNKLLEALKSNDTFNENDFTGMSFAEDASAIMEALDYLRVALESTDLTTVSDITNLFKDNKYKLYAYENIVNPLASAIESLLGAKTVSVFLKPMARIGLDKVSEKLPELELDFLLNHVDKEELVSDGRLLVAYVRDAMDLGVLELVRTNDIANFDVLKLADMVEGLYEFNILHENMPRLLENVLKYLDKKVKIDLVFEANDFAGINYQEEFGRLADIIREVKSLMESVNYKSLSNLTNCIKNKDYTVKNFFNQTAYNALINMIDKVADVETIVIISPRLVDYAVNEVYKKDIDIRFIQDGSYVKELIAQDVHTIANVARIAYSFGIIDLLFDNELANIDEVAINQMIGELANLNVLNLYYSKFVMVGLDYLETKVLSKNDTNAGEQLTKAIKNIKEEDFVGINLADDFAGLQNVVTAVKKLMNAKNIVSYSDVMLFLDAKDYNKKEFYDVETGEILAEVIRSASDVKTIAAIVKAGSEGILGEYEVTSTLTRDEVALDIRAIADLIVPAIKSDLIGLAFKESYKELELHIDEYKQMLAALEDTYILNKAYDKVANDVMTLVLKKLNAKQKVAISDFEGITYKAELPHLLSALDEFKSLITNTNIKTVNELLDFIKDKSYKTEEYATRENADLVLNMVNAIVDTRTLQVLLPVLTQHISNYLNAKKNLDVRYLFEYATSEELTADVKAIINCAYELVDDNMIAFALFKGEIDLTDFSSINNAIDTIHSLNILKYNKGELVNTILEKLKITETPIDLSDVDWDTENANIHVLVDNVQRLLSVYGANTLPLIKAMDLSKFVKIGKNSNEYFDILANITNVLSNSKLFEKTALIVAPKYLKADSKYAALTNIHTIYANGVELTTDLANLSTVLGIVRDLDLNGFLRNGNDYPFNKVDEITTLINLVCNTNYLNNENRLSEIIACVDKLVKQDLSVVDVAGIDLASDAPKFVEMYEFFVEITNNKYWTLVNSSSKFDAKLLVQAKVMESALDIVNKFMETTIYDKTGFSPIILLLPLIEKKLPAYYEALDLDNLTKATVEHDATYIQNIIKTLNDLDIVDLAKSQDYYSSDVHDAIRSILDDIYSLEILKGHSNALFNLLADDLFNNKKLDGIGIPRNTLRFNETDFVADKAYIETIIDELYQLFARENIHSKSDLTDFINSLKNKAGLESFFAQQANVDTLENIMAALAKLTLVKENAFNIMNEVVYPQVENKKPNYAKYFDFSMSTEQELLDDIQTSATIIRILNQLGVARILNDELIPYDNEILIKELLTALGQLNYVDAHKDAVVDLIAKFNLPISLDALRSDEFNFKADMAVLAQAYPKLVEYLTSAENKIVRYSDIKKFVKGEIKVDRKLLGGMKEHARSLVEAYKDLINLTSLTLLVPELVDYATPKVPEKYRGIIEAMSFDTLTFEQIHSDLAMSVMLIENGLDLRLYNAYKNKNLTLTGYVNSAYFGTVVTRAELIEATVTAIEDMYCFNDYASLLMEVIDIMGVDTTNVDLSSVNWDVEFDNLRTLIIEGISVLDNMNLNDVSEIKAYLKNLNKKNIKDEAKSFAKKVNFENLETIMNALDNSEVFNQLFKPLYNKYISSKVPARLAEIGDLTNYEISDLDEDMHRLALIVSALKEIKAVPGSIKDNAQSDECVIPAQVVIEQFFALNFLELKKQAIVRLVDSYVSFMDLSTLDLSGVDLASDGVILKQYAKEILTVVVESKLNPSVRQLGNQLLMKYAISLYNGSMDTQLFKTVLYWGYDKYVAPRVANRHYVSKYTTNEETADQIAIEIGNMLQGLLEMGFFSNDGVDFTNKAATDKLFGIFENVYNFSGKKMNAILKLKDNMDVLGIIPLDYSSLNTAQEKAAIKETLKVARKLFARLGELTADPVATLAKKDVQNEITDLFTNMFASSIAEQLAMPVARGIVTIFTRGIQEITILENVTCDQFVNVVLPDVFELVEKAQVVLGGSKKIDYTNTVAISSVVEVLVHRTTFYNNVEELMKYAFYILGVDVRSEDFSDVDWNSEYVALDKALVAMKDVMVNVDIHNSATYKNNDFLTALSVALPHFNNSKVLPKVARQLAEKVASRKGTRFDSYINHLYRSDYTNDLLMADYRLLPQLIQAVVELNYFGTGIDYSNFDSAETILDIFFKLHYFKGIEAEVLTKLAKRVDLVKDYEIDFYAVTDWSVEGPELVKVASELAKLGHLVDVKNLSEDDFSRAEVQNQFVILVDAMSKSIIGRQILPKYYENEIETKLGSSEYTGIIDFSLSEFTPDKWAAEFEKLFNAYNILKKCGYGTSTGKMSIADARDVLVIFFGTRADKSLGVLAATTNPKLWVTRLYNNNVIVVPNNATIDLSSDRDWEEEPYALIDALEQMINFTDSEGNFSYANVYACDDENKLNSFFNAIVNCDGVKAAMMPMIVNAMASDTNIKDSVVAAGLIDEDFKAEYDAYMANGSFDENYWTTSKLEAFANAIAQANK